MYRKVIIKYNKCTYRYIHYYITNCKIVAFQQFQFHLAFSFFQQCVKYFFFRFVRIKFEFNFVDAIFQLWAIH